MREPTDQQRWKELQKRLKEARAALKVNKEGDIPVPYGMRIVATFGPHLDIESFRYRKIKEVSDEALLGWQRRSWNGILCAEKLLPFWKKINLTKSNILEELNKAKKVVKSGSPFVKEFVTELTPSHSTLNADFLQSTLSPDLERAVGAYSIAELAIVFTYGDIDNTFDLNLTYEQDAGSGPFDFPNVFYASIVTGGGEAWGLHYRDDRARREFWSWWLNEAVPASWNLQGI